MNKRKIIGLITVIITCLTCLFACAPSTGPAPQTSPENTADTEKPKDDDTTKTPFVYERVVIIGVDGAGAFFDDANATVVNSIFDNGATTNTMQASVPSISAECWGSILTGVSPQKHGLTNSIISSTEYASAEYPTLFKLLRDAFPTAELASIVNWSPINTGIVENGLGVTKTSCPTDAQLTTEIVDYIESTNFRFLFVQFDQVDAAGHNYGYGSEEHLQQIRTTDTYISSVYSALSENGGMDDTLFIVTSDHGGNNKSHGGSSSAEVDVFFGVVGKTVANVALGSISNRDIPAIVCTALGCTGNLNWESVLPEGLFVED